jgi:asparagine synthase (glutamine-hydrolysing)
MCRLVGFVDFNFDSSYSLEETITSMRDIITHGGPDDAGIFIDKDFPIAFGHRRLSSLDLSSLGHQPMEFENLVITYNGEVYNFKEIRRELEKEGLNLSQTQTQKLSLRLFTDGVFCGP